MKRIVVYVVALVAIILMSSCATEHRGACYVKGYSTAYQKVYVQTVKSHRQRAVKCSGGTVFATYKRSF